MNRIFLFLLFVTALLAALYLHERGQRKDMADVIVKLEKTVQQQAGNCEERLAQQRFELEEKLAQRHGLDGIEALNDLQETLRSQRLRTHAQTLHEMNLRLDLSDDTGRIVTDALNAFTGGKRQLVSETRADGTFLSEAHLDKIDELRRQVLKVIDTALTEVQWEKFVEHGFIDRLDLQTQGN